MKDEFRLRLVSPPVEQIGQALGRARAWFHTWWRRYQALSS